MGFSKVELILIQGCVRSVVTVSALHCSKCHKPAPFAIELLATGNHQQQLDTPRKQELGFALSACSERSNSSKGADGPKLMTWKGFFSSGGQLRSSGV